MKKYCLILLALLFSLLLLASCGEEPPAETTAPAVTTAPTVTTSAPHIHEYTVYEKNSGLASHRKICACGDAQDEPCSGGVANCSAPAVCEKCSASYGSKNTALHTFGEWNEPVAATCVTKGKLGYYRCEGCSRNYDAEGERLKSLSVALDPQNHESESRDLCLNKGDEGHLYAYTCCRATYVAHQAHEMENGACRKCGYFGYARVDAQGRPDEEGDYILFGSYPQSEVTDPTLASALTAAAGDLPTEADAKRWTNYGYYLSLSNETPYMWYIDISHTDGHTYRGVYFTTYRPRQTHFASSDAASSKQYANGYLVSEGGESHVYWFRYEPVMWTILAVKDDRALLHSQLVLDAQPYHHDFRGEVLPSANAYQTSLIQSWLNAEFYQSAFGELQQELIVLTTVKNGLETTGDSVNPYVCEDFDASVFLLSYQEFMLYKEKLGLPKSGTDYAKSQGLEKETDSTEVSWWLRSPHGSRHQDAKRLYGTMPLHSFVNESHIGVAPAVTITLTR